MPQPLSNSPKPSNYTLTLYNDASGLTITDRAGKAVQNVALPPCYHEHTAVKGARAVLAFLNQIQTANLDSKVQWMHQNVEGNGLHCAERGRAHPCSLDSMMVFVRGVVNAAK